MTNIVQLRRIAEKHLKVPAMLHDYQWEGVAFLYRTHSALLADEMGLGKTVQTAVALTLLINGHSEINRALIVAPASLTINWMEELSTWAPTLVKRRVQGNAREREVHYLLPIPVLVSSYDQIRYDGLDRIPSKTFDLVVLDEAQRIKNRDSATALSCRLLPRKRAWALSATPLENEEKDILSILSFLESSFSKELSKVHISKRLESIMLRRRKKDVLSELPPVIFQDLNLELSESQMAIYNKFWMQRAATIKKQSNENRISIALLGLITRLKIICNFDRQSNVSSKLDALKVVIENAGNLARILVFSQFVETLNWISQRIDLPHDLLTGSMSIDERHVVIERFKTEPAPRALLISLRAGGVGLNLGNASHVVVFDRWWNPAVEIQAIYRAHRFDRTGPLHVVRFLVLNTVEEKIAQILDQKEELFNEVVEESTENSGHRFSEQELMEILQLETTDLDNQSMNGGE